MSSNLANWLVVVPARLNAARLPRKPLVDLGGAPLVVRVTENLAPLGAAGAEILVAVDAEEVRAVLTSRGIPAVMTRADHASGTDRCAEAAHARSRPYVLNVQGDEPDVSPEDLAALCAGMEARPEADVGTLVYESRDPAVAADPNAVKALRRRDGYALYFSRAALPYDRDEPGHLPPVFWHHIGVYAYRRARLLEFAALPPSALERAERLEQLRALEAGWRIWLAPASRMTRGIDTPADLEAARARR